MHEIVDFISHDSFSNSFVYKGKQETLYDNSSCFQEVTANSIDELLVFSTTDIAYSYRGQT